jgi:hypothetical protein
MYQPLPLQHPRRNDPEMPVGIILDSRSVDQQQGGSMNGKDKLRRALNHQDTAVPVDFGSNAVTGMHVRIVAALREHYGLERHPVKVIEPYQMLGMIEEDLKLAIGVDVDGIYPRGTMFGFANEDWKPWKAPWGQELLVSGHFNVTTSAAGDTRIHPAGDLTAPASAVMPSSGYFFDTIIRQEAFDEDHLRAEDNLEEFGPLTDADLAYFKADADAVRERQATGQARGVCANFGGTGLGDIALVTAPMLRHPKGIRDITEWYISTAARQDLLHEIFSRQVDIALQNLARIKALVGDVPDVAFICGTDFGTQTSSFCSTETYDTLYHPYYKRVNDWIHQHTGWKTFKHCCGAVENFMEHFIASGFDIVNPVQISATGMDPRLLKQRYGDRLVFWGGGVNTQKQLPYATPAEVRDNVLQLCDIFAKGGGFVFNAVHNVQANVPIQNVVAMIEAVKEFNGGH